MVKDIYELAFNIILPWVFFSLALFFYFFIFTPVTLISAALSGRWGALFLFIYLQKPEHPRLIDWSVNQVEEFGWKINPTSTGGSPPNTPRSWHRSFLSFSPLPLRTSLFLPIISISCLRVRDPLLWSHACHGSLRAHLALSVPQGTRIPSSCQGAIPPLSLLTSQRQCSF